MAAAQVAGAAGLIISLDNALSASELKADILSNVHPVPSLAGKVITGGRLDVCKALPGCEAAAHPSTATLPVAPAASPGRSRAVELMTATLSIVRGKARIRLRCAASRRCAGKLTLTVRTRTRSARRSGRRHSRTTELLTIGRGTFSLRPGQDATVAVTLSSSGNALARTAHGHLVARLTIATTSPSPSAIQLESVRLQ